MRSFITSIAVSALIALTGASAQPAQAQTYKVIYNFAGGPDGGTPVAGLTLDRAGTLYGTTSYGGASGYGTVYHLKRKGADWGFNTLYGFTGGSDGAFPEARVIFGPNSTLYGTTSYGGASGYGTVFDLKPPPRACTTAPCPWTETVLYPFTGDPDGANPHGDPIFDEAGNTYGTTRYGGSYGEGAAYEVTPSGSGYTEMAIYSFGAGSSDGAYPFAGVILDNAGNLYGTTSAGGNSASQCGPYGCGTVFEVKPSGRGWTEKILYSFQAGSDGYSPYAGLIFDRLGNGYGATTGGGTGGGGTVFELSPSGEGWTFTLLYSFTGTSGCGPWGNLVMDVAGNLYGTTQCDGAKQLGSVFKLTPTPTPPWTYTSLHDFTCNDGGYPISNVIFDASGNLYGTTASCGLFGAGVVWEITP
jgi:uncharacterized repeat protein (TIGR03803 family)